MSKNHYSVWFWSYWKNIWTSEVIENVLRRSFNNLTNYQFRHAWNCHIDRSIKCVSNVNENIRNIVSKGLCCNSIVIWQRLVNVENEICCPSWKYWGLEATAECVICRWFRYIKRYLLAAKFSIPYKVIECTCKAFV